ncbi:MAG: hypothetical protein QOE70_5708 [Chthoniobacter sp.]|jgi:hypothetical protein|nr:hypothetical protein [Chthoniobacter sp.]
MSEITAPSPHAPGLPVPLARALDRVRARWLAVRIAEFPVLLVAGLALAWVVQAAADRLLELSWQTRLILLLMNVCGALALLWFFAARPWWRRLNRPQAALLVERELPQFRTALISAVELGSPEAQVPLASRALVRQLLADVSRAVEQEDLAPRVVRPRRLQRFAWAMVGALVVAGICFALAQPLSALLVQRILLSRTPFPAQTQVVNGSGDLDLVAGADAALIAQAQGVVPSSGRLVVTYEDGRVETITVSPVAGQPARFAFTVKNVRQAFGYHFELNDGVGAAHRVAVRFPPAVKELRFVQVYPKYTGLPETVMSPANLRLLEGSKLRVEATASAPLRGAVLEIKGKDQPVPLTVSGPEKNALKAELAVPGSGWKAFSLHLENATGESSVNDPVYRVDLLSDQPPLAALMQPKKESSTVLAQAKIPVAFKVSDDFGLRRVAFRYRVFRPGLTGAPEPAEEGQFPFEIAAGEKALNQTMQWDLGRLVPPVSPGCSITCWAEAEDAHAPAPNKPGVITQSAEKVLVIVTEEQKRQELIEQLGERARDLERLYEMQRNMNEKTDNSLR